MVKVKTILEVKEKDYMNMDKTIFQDEQNQVVYTFSKVEEGKEYDGEVTKDKGGNLKFKKANSSFGGRFDSKPKEFKADPVKNASIERQVALKCAVELLAAELPYLEKQPKTADLAKAALTIAEAFDSYFKQTVVQSTAQAEKTPESDAPALTDDDMPADIDVDTLEF